MSTEGYKPFATGEILTAADVTNLLMKQSVIIVDDATDRDNQLDGSPVAQRDGMISYNKENSNVSYYDDEGRWNALSPTGSVVAFAGATAPEGWLLCNGAAYNQTDYSRLYGVILLTYGQGAAGTFRVPNLQTRVPLGAGTGFSRGSTGGNASTTLTTANLPSHTHGFNRTLYGPNTDGVPRPNLRRLAVGQTEANLISVQSYTGRTTGTGSGTAFSNRQPYLALNFIIKT